MQIDFTSENKAYSVHETGLENNKHAVYEVTGIRNQHSLYVGGTTKLIELIETNHFVSVSLFMHRLLEEMKKTFDSINSTL